MFRRSLALVLLVAACDEADPTPLAPSPANADDSGVTPDLGTQSDLGPQPDLGIRPDLGLPVPDAGRPDLGGLGLCEVRAETGPCLAAIERFTFDPALGRCVAFTWGGCGDNPNNYETLAACLGSCAMSVRLCGGFGGQRCAGDEVCDFPYDSCGAADGIGQCLPRPQGCHDVYDPVCGCDGQTYSNLCDAHASGVDAASSGPC